MFYVVSVLSMSDLRMFIQVFVQATTIQHV
jgi:hypothetical protein